MKNNILYYAPRVIAIFFILLIGLFVQDIFNDEVQIPNLVTGLVIHLIPSFVLTLALLYAWKHERIGGFIFLLLFTLALIVFKNPYPTNLLLFGPLVLAALLFELHYAEANFIKKGKRVRKLHLATPQIHNTL